MADYDSISSKANSWWNRLSDSEQQLYQHNYYPDLDFKDVASNIKKISKIFIKELQKNAKQK